MPPNDRLGRLALALALAGCLLAPARAQTPMMLTQDMFAEGTLILANPGLYTLASDIVFNPNPRSAGGDSNPRPAQLKSAGGLYDDAAYGLGFFAAIVITGPNITLDLNGFTLSQHIEHMQKQRFFALIELSSAPFLMVADGGCGVNFLPPARSRRLPSQNQGPHDFATGDLATPRCDATPP